MKLLIAEDDKEAAGYLKRALTEAGHAVDVANDGRDGLLLAAGEVYDVIVLDRMLPHVDGLAILRTIRASGVKTPVLLLTALGGIDDRVEGLEAGADDYLVKPFAFAEMLARVNALARRPPPQEVRTELSIADLKLDLMKRTVSRGGRRIELQPREYQILEFLLRHAGHADRRQAHRHGEGLAEAGDAHVEVGHVLHDPLAQRDGLQVSDIAAQRHLGIGAAVDIFEEDVGEPAARELPIVRHRCRAHPALHLLAKLGARCAPRRKA